MYFALTDEQQELVRTVRSLVGKRAGSLDLRAAVATDPGYDEELWRALCEEIGAAALAVPEEYGGAGFSYLETHLVLEELGAGLTPSPLLGSGVLATQALLLSGASDACRRLLPALADGSSRAALVWADTEGRWPLAGSGVTATPGEPWRLDGRATLVLDGVGADLLVVVATTASGPGLFEVLPGHEGTAVAATPGVDLTLRFADVEFTGAPARLLTADAAELLPRLRAVGAIATTALQTGAAQRALDLTVAYLKERVQFGRPLGSFQALKHRCAHMLVAVETARSMSWAAAWSVANAQDTVERQAALAKSWCSDAFSMVAGEMVQLHGGIAITWEHDAHLYFKRAHATAQLFGRAAEHRRALIPQR
ncbi:acyl-CoA dehydrogenase family protein [Streptomyces sp. NPDC057580]|uniref:acyl-CoA dehydrogenase family protein n=1 Tax=Streptomyces sp. NPDC057580 TaxID=3346173 RepID=UPI0036ABD284